MDGIVADIVAKRCSPIEVLADGREVSLTSAREQALLGTLVLTAGEVVSVDTLIDSVWGERAPASGRPAWSTSTCHASGVCRWGLGHRLTRAPGYIVERDACDVDARVHRMSGRRTRRGGRGGAGARRHSTEALGLWRGDALSDVALEVHAHFAAARLDDERRIARSERVEHRPRSRSPPRADLLARTPAAPSRPSRTTSACSGRPCLRSIAKVDRPMHSPATARAGRGWQATLGSSPGSTCGPWSRRSCNTTPDCRSGTGTDSRCPRSSRGADAAPTARPGSGDSDFRRARRLRSSQWPLRLDRRGGSTGPRQCHRRGGRGIRASPRTPWPWIRYCKPTAPGSHLGRVSRRSLRRTISPSSRRVVAWTAAPQAGAGPRGYQWELFWAVGSNPTDSSHARPDRPHIQHRRPVRRLPMGGP